MGAADRRHPSRCGRTTRSTCATRYPLPQLLHSLWHAAEEFTREAFSTRRVLHRFAASIHQYAACTAQQGVACRVVPILCAAQRTGGGGITAGHARQAVRNGRHGEELTGRGAAVPFRELGGCVVVG